MKEIICMFLILWQDIEKQNALQEEEINAIAVDTSINTEIQDNVPQYKIDDKQYITNQKNIIAP